MLLSFTPLFYKWATEGRSFTCSVHLLPLAPPPPPPWPFRAWSAGEKLVWCPTTPGKRTGKWGGLSTRPDGHSNHLTAWSIQKTVWDSRTTILLRVEPPCTAGGCVASPSGWHDSHSSQPELWLCSDLYQFLPFFVLVCWWDFLKLHNSGTIVGYLRQLWKM